jgi:hypothetical protein
MLCMTFRLVLCLTTCLYSHVAAAASVMDWERTNPGGGGSFLSIEARNGTIVAGSDLSGAYIKKNGLDEWENIGASRGMTATHVSEVAFHPDEINGKDQIFLGTDRGIFRSDDGGDTFVHALDLSATYKVAYVTDIQVAPGNHNLLYAAVHVGFWGSPFEARIYRSTNRGVSWIFAGGGGLPGDTEGLKHQIAKLVLDPLDSTAPVTMYGVTGDVWQLDDQPSNQDNLGRLYKSTNGGMTWSRVQAALGSIMDFVLHPDDPTSMYLTSYDGLSGSMEGSVWRKIGSADWELVRSDYSGILQIDTAAPDTIRTIDPRQQFAWNSKAGTWEASNAWDATPSWHRLPTGFTGNSCTRYPSSVFSTQRSPVCNWDHFWLANTGKEPQAYFPSYTGYIKTFGRDILNEDTLLWANSQWVFSSTDRGGVFNNLFTTEKATGSDEWRSSGIDNVNMLEIAASEQNHDLVFLGFFDMGCWRSTDGGDSWQSCNIPNTVDNPFNPGVSFGWKKASGGNVATIVTDPSRVNYVWMSMSPIHNGNEPTYLMRSTQAGERDSWAPMATDGSLPLREINGLSTDHNDLTASQEPRTLFVTADGRVYRSTDDGMTWGNAPIFNCSCGCRQTAVDYLDSETVFAGGEAGLFVSTDGGINWNTLISRDDIGSPAEIDLCDQGWSGIYESNWRGVFDIKTDPYNSGVAFVAVYGRGKGLYRIDSQDGGDWSITKLRTDDYMRGAAVFSDPYVSLIYTTSSSTMTDGTQRSGSSGIYFSTDNYYQNDEGSLTWHEANDGMAWKFAMPVTIRGDGMIFAGSPGSGIQRSRIVCDDDSDCDGLSNSFEISINTDPGNADSDYDGVTDFNEVAYDGNNLYYDPVADLDPLDADSDNDDFGDGLEIAYSTDPLNINSQPILGDLNADNIVNAGDVALAEQIVLGLHEPDAYQSVLADVAPIYSGISMPDGNLNAADVLLIVRKALGLVDF